MLIVLIFLINSIIMLTIREIHASLQLPIRFYVTINLTIYVITCT